MGIAKTSSSEALARAGSRAGGRGTADPVCGVGRFRTELAAPTTPHDPGSGSDSDDSDDSDMYDGVRSLFAQPGVSSSDEEHRTQCPVCLSFTPLVKHRAGRCPRLRHSAGKNTRLKRQVSQLRHTVTTLRISKALRAAQRSAQGHGGLPRAHFAKALSAAGRAPTRSSDEAALER